LGGRSIDSAGSEGMPFLPHQGNGNAETCDHRASIHGSVEPYFNVPQL